MRRQNLWALFFLGTLSVVGCASKPAVPVPFSVAPESAVVETKKSEEPAMQPIIVPDSPVQLATIDPKTLKVTYSKGADPKKVVDQLVKSWAQATQSLQQCQQAYQGLLDQKK